MSFDYASACISENQNIPHYSLSECSKNTQWTDLCKKSFVCTTLKDPVKNAPTLLNVQDTKLENCIYNKYFENNPAPPKDGIYKYDDLVSYKDQCFAKIQKETSTSIIFYVLLFAGLLAALCVYIQFNY